ncbi:MAG TPA: hypothetical protein VF355_06330 [Anaerolineaceae bacterium]
MPEILYCPFNASDNYLFWKDIQGNSGYLDGFAIVDPKIIPKRLAITV